MSAGEGLRGEVLKNLQEMERHGLHFILSRTGISQVSWILLEIISWMLEEQKVKIAD